jgi:argininosuccinate lyase
MALQEKICEDSSSFDLTSADLATVMEELSRLAEKLYELAKNEDTLVEMTGSSSMPGKARFAVVVL